MMTVYRGIFLTQKLKPTIMKKFTFRPLSQSLSGLISKTMKSSFLITIMTISLLIKLHAQNNLTGDSLRVNDSISKTKDSVKTKRSRTASTNSSEVFNPYLPYNPSRVSGKSERQNPNTKDPDHPANILGNLLLQLVAERTRHAFEQ
jgi:hypothetical protein